MGILSIFFKSTEEKLKKVRAQLSATQKEIQVLQRNITSRRNVANRNRGRQSLRTYLNIPSAESLKTDLITFQDQLDNAEERLHALEQSVSTLELKLRREKENW